RAWAFPPASAGNAMRRTSPPGVSTQPEVAAVAAGARKSSASAAAFSCFMLRHLAPPARPFQRQIHAADHKCLILRARTIAFLQGCGAERAKKSAFHLAAN